MITIPATYNNNAFGDYGITDYGDACFNALIPSALSRRRCQAPSALLHCVSAASRRQRRRDRAMGLQGFDAAIRRAAPGSRRRSLGGLRPGPRAAVKPRRRRRAPARLGLTASTDQAALRQKRNAFGMLRQARGNRVRAWTAIIYILVTTIVAVLRADLPSPRPPLTPTKRRLEL